MAYQIQRGDTIARVKDLTKMNWNTLRRLNPHAVGRSSRTGNWFLKEGSTIKGGESFETVLRQKGGRDNPVTDNSRDSAQWTEYTIKPGDTLWSLAVKKFHVHVEDLIKDNGIKDPGRIRPGQKIKFRQSSWVKQQAVVASWYGESYHGRPMANGRPFDMYADTVAHKGLPLGTRIELENPLTGERANATVTDRGPYVRGRDVDISYGLARKLSMVKKGIAKLTMRVLG